MKSITKSWTVLCLILISLSATAETVTIGQLKYDLNGTEAYVSGYIGEPVDVVIPATIISGGQTFNVTTILDGAFSRCESLVRISAQGSNLKTIYSAFYGCSKLKYIWFPCIELICGGAFNKCVMLEYVVLPNTLLWVNPYGSTYSWDYYENRVFEDCTRLQAIIYLGLQTSKCHSNADVFNINNMITWNSSDITYTGKTPAVDFTNNLPAGFRVTSYDMSGLDKSVGTHTMNVPFTFTNDDMSFDVEIPYTYTINKAPLTAKVKNESRPYGSNNPEFKVQYYGWVNGENESVLSQTGTFSCSANMGSNVGEYPIVLTNVIADNYDITIQNGTLTVTKAQLSAVPKNVTRLYGEQNPDFTILYTGLKNNESEPEWITRPTIVTEAKESSAVGEYAIKIVGGEAHNYNLSKSDGVLTIDLANLRITADNKTRLYFEENPELTYYCSGFMNNEDENILKTRPTLNTQATKKSNVGIYPITITGATADNYRVEMIPGNLDIKKRTLTVSTDNYTRYYNEANPEFMLKYAGFVNNESINDILIEPQATTSATKESDVGIYNIDISGGAAANYEFVYNGGKLTIEKAYQELTWEQDLSNIEPYNQIELTATATSNLPIDYSVEGAQICSVVTIGTRTYLDCFAEGETVVYAIQPGNQNWWQTTKIYKKIKISGSMPTSINGINVTNCSSNIHHPGGIQNNKLHKGLNIIRLADGTTRKVVVK